MKKLAFGLLAAMVSVCSFAQTTNKAGGDVPVASVPLTGCKWGNLIFKTTTTKGHYQCGDDGNYHVLAGGGSAAWGGITGTLSAQTDLQSALNLKAPITSPSLLGTPTAPTATGGTNTTQIATTAFVQSAVAGVSVPVQSVFGRTGTVAAAGGDYAASQITVSPSVGGNSTTQTVLADHESRIVANTTSIAAKLAAANNLSDLGSASTARTNLGLAASATTDTTNASNISSGTLPTGRLPAHTGDATSSAGSVALTVKQAHWNVVAKTNAQSPYAVASTDTVITCDATAGTTTINLPSAIGSGRMIDIKKLDSSSNPCAITPNGTDTIDGVNVTLSGTAQNANHWLIDSGSGAWITGHRLALGGDLSGTSNSVTVVKVNGNTPGGTCANQFVRSVNSSAVPACATVALATDVSGTLPASAEPAHTGDVINSAGSLAMTLASVATAGTTGDGTHTLTTTIDAKGRTTSVTANPITGTPSNGNFDIGSGALTIDIANEGTTGTATNKLAKLTGAPSTLITTTTSDTTGAVGICVSSCSTTGAAVIARAGQAACVFDGATTAGDYVQISTTTPGDCHDSGLQTYPTSGGQVLGRVLSTNGSAGTYTTTLHMGTQAASSGGAACSTCTANVLQKGNGANTLQDSNLTDGATVLKYTMPAAASQFVIKEAASPTAFTSVLQITDNGGTEKFAIYPTGAIYNGGAGAYSSATFPFMNGNSNKVANIGSQGTITVQSGAVIGVSASSTDAGSGTDVAFSRIAPGVMALGNGTQGSVAGVLQTNMAPKINPTAKTANYTTLGTDSTLLADTSGGAFTITLSSANAVAGQVYTFKCTTTSANALTLSPSSGNIDGSASTTLNPTTIKKSVMVQFDGSNWWVIGTFTSVL